MNRRQLLSAITWPALSVAAAETAPRLSADAWLKKAPHSFVMAYHFENLGKVDERPRPGDDPFTKNNGRWIPAPRVVLSQDELRLDTATLVAATKERVQLTEADVKELMTALLDSKEKPMLMECYDPHHVVIFYDAHGAPTAAVEICFSCERIQMFPNDMGIREFRTYDLLSVARLFARLGLPLGYKDLAEYEKTFQLRRSSSQ